jgi:hypothetical protein
MGMSLDVHPLMVADDDIHPSYHQGGGAHARGDESVVTHC